jgi:hypothetical protein
MVHARHCCSACRVLHGNLVHCVGLLSCDLHEQCILGEQSFRFWLSLDEVFLASGVAVTARPLLQLRLCASCSAIKCVAGSNGSIGDMTFYWRLSGSHRLVGSANALQWHSRPG